LRLPESKPLASLSLDLDNKWSYMKTHGDPGWESLPSYLDVVIPRVLRLLAERKLTITFFVVGLDAAQERHHGVLRSLADAGHEIGNHSFRHEPWLHLYSDAQLREEIEKAEHAIESATGVHPVGFRGPGFSVSTSLLEVLASRGYMYDASTFPTYLGPLARAYYFLKSPIGDPEEKERRKKLFGTLADGLRPNGAYRWRTSHRELIEIPVTTMPMFKVPIHLSYLLYLSSFSASLALAYFQTAMLLCRMSGTQPSLLLHPLDFLGCDDTADLSFFPAMQMKSSVKVRFAEKVLDQFNESFEVVAMREHAARLESLNLAQVQPGFS
jgi:peptidoglycan-N-acetylglucosamine deacetylase